MEQSILIDSTTKIKFEHNNYILCYLNAKGSWINTGYYPTLESLLSDWVDNTPAHSKVKLKNLREVVLCIQHAERQITKLIKGQI